MDLELIVQLESNLLTRFNPDTMDYLKWMNSFEYVTEVMKITDKNKVNFLLQMLENSVVTIITYQLDPYNPSESSYEKITSIIETVYGKFQGENAAYYRFLHRNQFPYEPVEHYINVLKMLFSKCPATMQNEDNLKVRFVEGLKNEVTKAILKEHSDDMTLDTAITIANQGESARNDFLINFD